MRKQVGCAITEHKMPPSRRGINVLMPKPPCVHVICMSRAVLFIIITFGTGCLVADSHASSSQQSIADSDYSMEGFSWIIGLEQQRRSCTS